MTTPAASDDSVRQRFSKQRRTGTVPETRLRRELHGRGLRYRVDRAVLRDRRKRVDVVFGPSRVAVFVDGCFWHMCPEHGNIPHANHQWWQEKLLRNVARDRETDEQLRDAGWAVLRFWEHEIRADVVAVADHVAAVVQARRPGEGARSR